MLLPITIIGGYLGAGKTTLVNHLLRHAEGVKLAILVNEFGELPIDEDLIEAQDDDIISIAGGCVCCSYGNDLTMAMLDLIKMDPPPDHVLLEASGVALPGAIAASVSLIDGYQMDGVVVLADAETIREQADDAYIGDTIIRQITDADLIVLNKSDLLTEENLNRAKTWLKEKSQNTEIIPASHCILPPETLLQSFLGRERSIHRKHVHQTDVFDTLSFTVDGRIDAHMLACSLSHADLGLVRAKGFIDNINGERVCIQIVGRRWAVSVVQSSVSIGLVTISKKPSVDTTVIETLITKFTQ